MQDPGAVAVAEGALLRPGMNDPRVPELARRLHSGGYLAQLPSGNGKQYQGELVKAVKAFQLSHSLQADGVGVIWVTHDLGQLERLATWVVVVIGGAIAQAGPVADVLGRPTAPVAAFLSGDAT